MSLQSDSPFVRIVLLNYNGGESIVRAVAAAVATDWPRDRLQVVCVDNGSSDGSIDSVAVRYPEVHIVRNGVNLGFPGNNTALDELGDVDYVALVNSDAFVEADWLRHLVARAETDRGIGAVCPKILFSGDFAEIPVNLSALRNSKRQTIRLRALRVNGRDQFDRCHVAHGGGRSSDRDGIFEWIFDGSILRFPLGKDDYASESLKVEVEIQVDAACDATIGGVTTALTVAGDRQVVSLVLDAIPPAVAVLNNVGSWIDQLWIGHERGLFSVDEGEFDSPTEVGAWCGAAVLLRSSMLEDVGLFDDAFFLYYEDTDLAVRGRERGWRYVTEPSSRVRHDHSASTIEGSERTAIYIERNRMMFAVRHASFGEVIRILLEFVLVTVSYAVSELGRASRQRRKFDGTVVFRRVNSLSGFFKLLPNALRARKEIARRRLISRRELAQSLSLGSGVSDAEGS